MKKLSINKMSETKASFAWKSFVDGACVGLAFLPPYGTGACIAWGVYRGVTSQD